MFEIITLPNAKIKVTKYDNTPPNVYKYCVDLSQNGKCMPFAQCLRELNDFHENPLQKN